MVRLAAPSVYVKERATDCTDIKPINADQEISVQSVVKTTLNQRAVPEWYLVQKAIIGCCFIRLLSLIDPKLLC